jgi:hypothetical protein
VKNADKIFGCTKHSAIILNQKELAYSLQKNQVDAMNGNIMVESKPNMGTTFKIYSMIKKENMVIDDDEIYQIIVAKIIQKRICSRLFFFKRWIRSFD